MGTIVRTWTVEVHDSLPTLAKNHISNRAAEDDRGGIALVCACVTCESQWARVTIDIGLWCTLRITHSQCWRTTIEVIAVCCKPKARGGSPVGATWRRTFDEVVANFPAAAAEDCAVESGDDVVGEV
jgi:hypothetical protein